MKIIDNFIDNIRFFDFFNFVYLKCVKNQYKISKN